MDIPWNGIDWFVNLRFNEQEFVFFNKRAKHTLLTDLGAFRNCSLEQRGTSYAVLGSSKAERGWIWHDIEASGDLRTEQCVVVGRRFYEDEHGLKMKKYYILVVRPTDVDREYMRVGVGWIQSDYVVRQRLNVRIV